MVELLGYAGRYRARIAFAIFSSVANKLFDVLPEVMTGLIVDVVVNNRNSFLAHMGITDTMHQLTALGILACVIQGFQSLFDYICVTRWKKIAQSIQHDARLAVFMHVQRLAVSYYESVRSSALISVLNEDIQQLERFMSTGIDEFIKLIAGTLIIGCIFLYLAPTIACCAFAPIPIILIISYFFHERLAKKYRAVRAQAAHVAATLSHTIVGIATVKSYTAQEYEIERVRRESLAYKDIQHETIMLSGAMIPIIRMIIVFGLVVTIVLGGQYALHGIIGVGSYSILVFQTQRLLWPFTRLAELTDWCGRAKGAAQRVYAILQIPGIEQSGVRVLHPAAVRGIISLTDVSFAYPNGIRVFDTISFTFAPGKTTAIIGATGSGKSTLVKLLLRFYDPEKGHIAIDGVDIRELSLHNLRQLYGLVSQEIFLFHGTVRDNIAYGTPQACDEDIVRAAQRAQAHDFIQQLPQGYQTIVGESGYLLSGGQRQRIAIARALLKNPPIFIFDEATSAVDTETEAAIQHSLAEIARNHTTIIIAHRLSTVRNADTIVVMESGSIVEVGTHDELVARAGVYTNLWCMQTGMRNERKCTEL